ncbi:MAG: LamG domain-containing protein, partial [Anaerolineae bacterium]|nr:LamG domain-containing protein [Anaerolineae bacterium]
MYDKWQYDGGYVNALAPGYLAYLPEISDTRPLGAPGFNRPMSFILAEGYNVPMQECICPLAMYWIFVPVCYIRPFQGTNHINMGQGIAFDVFPATLDDFYALTAKDGGYALAWGQEGALTFPRLKDADGDGLRNSADGGSDPNDLTWDTDGDCLSDLYESQRGTNPRSVDTDNDGLSDFEEIRLGTSFYHADTDEDGLTDAQEVTGWELYYSPVQFTWITSDPTQFDTDGDGWNDYLEKSIGFNPRVPQGDTFMSLSATAAERAAPDLLLRFEEANGSVAFSDVQARFTGTCQGDTCPASGIGGRYGNAAQFDGWNDGVSFADAPEFNFAANQDFTIALWVKADATQAWTSSIDNDILSKSGARYPYAIRYYNQTSGLPGHIYVVRYDGANSPLIVSTHNINDGQFHHVAFIKSGGTLSLYLDGNLEGTTADTTGDTTNTAPLTIGQRGGGNYFKGVVDEVAFFDHALATADLQALLAGVYNLADQIAKPGDTLTYEATVQNHLPVHYARGLLRVDFPAAMTSSLTPQPFEIRPSEAVSLSGNVQVAASAATGMVTMTQIAEGHMINPREGTEFPELLLHFNEAAGATTFLDNANLYRQNNGTCSGTHCPTAGVEGKFETALQFDGVDDYVQVAKTPALQLTNGTLALWFKADPGQTAYQTLLSDGLTQQGYSYGLNTKPGFSTGKLDVIFSFNTDRGWGSGGLSVYDALADDGQWHHIALVRDDTIKSLKLYIDGTFKQSASYTGEVDNNNQPLTIGATVYQGNTSSAFKGIIDNVRIYSRPLADKDIGLLFQDAVFKSSFDNNVVNGSSTYWPDESGHGHQLNTLSTPPATGEGMDGGNALLINGEWQYLKTADAARDLVLGDRFTLSAWVYPASIRGTHQGILGNDLTYLWGDMFVPFPRLEVQWDDVWFNFYDTTSTWQGIQFQKVLTIGAWNHVLLSFDAGYARLYINGELKREHNFGSVLPKQGYTSSFVIGCLADRDATTDLGDTRAIKNQCLLGGRIDQVSIYKHAFDNTAARNLYESQSYALHLALDDAPGSARFSNVVAQNSATCAGAACPVAGVNGIINQAAQFDGQDDYLNFAPLTLSTGSVTLWYRQLGTAGGTGGDMPLIGSDDVHIGRRNNNQDWGGYWCGQWHTIAASAVGNDNAWHHAAFVFNGPTTSVYVDGALLGSATTAECAKSLRYVAQSGVQNNHFNGQIDDVIISESAFSAQDIANLYNQAPIFLLPLDEAANSTQYHETLRGWTGTCTGDACPKAGVKGQNGNAVKFTPGTYISGDLATTNPDFTFSAWVKWAGSPTGLQYLFVNHRHNNQDTTVAVYLFIDGRVVRVTESPSDTYPTLYYYEGESLKADVWTHIVVTPRFIYINGRTLPNSHASSPVYGLHYGDLADATFIGGFPYKGEIANFDGLMDDVTLYNRTLTPGEIWDTYLIQRKRIEDHQSTAFYIDADAPTSTLLSDFAYRPNRDAVLHVAAFDDAAGVSRAELGINGAWYDAPACRDATDEAAWCPTFDPPALSGEGRYTLQTRAIDAVGHVEVPTRTYTLYVDGTPPQVSTALQNNALLFTTPHPTEENAWSIALSGTVSDPVLTGGDAGSGVSDVRVTLLTPEGTPA